MWKMQITINLTDDEYTEEERQIQVQIEESLPDGLKDLDQWEADVRKMGFQTMREIYRRGIELYEKKLLSEYTHKGKQWVIPLNEALGLHDEDKERTSLALQQLSSLYAVNQPYRQAEEAVKDITQDTEAISHQQMDTPIL